MTHRYNLGARPDGRGTSEPPEHSGRSAGAVGRPQTLALAALTAGLILACLVLAWPLLPAIAWGVALAVIAWPIHVWLVRHIDRQGVAAFLTTLVVGAGVATAAVFVTYHFAREAAAAAE